MTITDLRLRRTTPGVPAVALLALGLLAGVLIPLGGSSIAIALALAVVGLGIAIYAPGVLFALYLLIPFYKGAAVSYSPVDITVVLAILNSLQIVAIIARRRQPMQISRVGLALWTIVALLVFAGVLYAPDQTLGLSHAVTFWLLVFIPIAIGSLRVGADQRYVRQLLWTFFAMGVFTVVVGLPGIASSDRLVVLGSNTINVASAALLVPLLGLTFVARVSSLRFRLAVLVLCLPAVLVALATGSRGPVLVLVAVAGLGILNYLAHPRSVDWIRTAAVTVVVCLGILLISFLSPLLPAYATSRFVLFGDFIQAALSGDVGAETASDTSSTARVGLYGVATTMFEERPVLGFGTAGFEAKSNQFLGYVEAYPHDALLQFASEYGLVGAALFVSIVVVGLVRRIPEEARPIKILFVYFVLQSMLSGDIFSDRTTWGLLLLLLLMKVPAGIHAARTTLSADGVARGALAGGSPA